MGGTGYHGDRRRSATRRVDQRPARRLAVACVSARSGNVLKEHGKTLGYAFSLSFLWCPESFCQKSRPAFALKVRAFGQNPEQNVLPSRHPPERLHDIEALSEAAV